MPRARMMREMGSRELSEWMAYNELDPIGEYRADLRMGILAATVANTGYARPQEAMAPADFMPDFLGRSADGEPDNDQEPTEAERAERLHAGFEMLRVLMGGKHIHRGEVVE
jgi:hypothetical protein